MSICERHYEDNQCCCHECGFPMGYGEWLAEYHGGPGTAEELYEARCKWAGGDHLSTKEVIERLEMLTKFYYPNGRPE